MTEPSYIEARGLPAVKKSHSGPTSAARLVEAYGCHVHPLKLGQKAPATENGLKDALPDASAITGNYGVVTGRSGIVAVDLDDYVADNEIQAFIDTFELPPTFTLTTGSGGRSMWYAAPEGVDLTQKLDFVRGVDIKAGESYVLGPGNRLHPDFIKKGAPGDGEYRFDKASPKSFTPLPQALVDALLAAKPKSRDVVTVSHDEYDAYDDRTRARIDGYVQRAVSDGIAKMRALADLDEYARNDEGLGWETGALHYTASLASLVLASWTGLDSDEVLELVIDAMPGAGTEFHGHGVGLFKRALTTDRVEPRPIPPELLEPEFEWWVEGTYRQVGFREAAGSEEALAAEEVTVEADPDDWDEQPWNEKGDVERTKRWAAGALKWLEDEDTWVTWIPAEHRWAKDAKAGARACQSALDVAERTEILNYDDAPQVDSKTGEIKPGTSQRDKFLKELRNRWGIGQFERVAKSLALSGAVSAASEEFDADGMLLAVKDGAVNLRSADFVPGTPELKVTVGSNVVYDPEATAPIFQRYLESSMPDPAVREYLQRIMGYSLIGGNPEQAFFIHWGPQTNNGKTVLLNVVRRIMGSQMRAASSKSLIKTKGDKHSVEIADLAGPRILQMGETGEGAQIEEETVKQITGKDVIGARKLNESNKDWLIDGKIHILTNYLPHISASPSLKRRLHLIVWPVEIEGDKVDLDLEDKIVAQELSGVLNWLLEGCLNWQKQLSRKPEKGERKSGLSRPGQAVVDLEKYFFDEDTLAEWMLERTHEGVETKSSTLYEDYKTWCWPKSVKPMSANAFGRKLREKKLNRIERSDANYYPLGLKTPTDINSYFK